MSQPTTKHHADWLSLLEISGPFLSMPVLTAAFPQGLDLLEEGQARSLRADYEFWTEKVNDPAVHTAWIRLVLESLLEYVGADAATPVLLSGQAISAGWKAEFPEHEETLRPDLMLVEPGGKTPQLLIQVYPPSQNLEKPVQGSRWQASVATRMMELLHATEVSLGLVTNGEQWMLVNAPRGETTGFTSWYAELWFDEPITLRAFKSLLGVQRFFGVAADQTLESLLKASANDQQEITDQLGLQVRHAVEILIQMIDRADQDSGGKLLGKNVSPDLLYEAALTVMMRLVFMLSAEERKLLPLDDSLYAENYAVSTLYAQLSVTEEEVLERRFDAWSRLLAVFRAVHSGIRHERLSLLPYGGSLFDPEKYPFLEGRTTQDAGSGTKTVPLPVNNRTVLHLLKALQILQVEGEARRISFRALDVEQIGHVYEGLLDHRAVRASELVLGLRGAKRIEPEVTLSALEQAAGKKESDFLAWLNDKTGRSLPALKNSVASDILQKDPDFANHLRAACGNDEALFARVKPFAGLLRTDDFEAPALIQAGSVYVTLGTTRRATGTHYTPRSLTEPVVQHTLEPLVYIGPAEGLPREAWKLRQPEELLALKICDMAMGSGGFLVQVVRYLAERLVEAWALYGEDLADGEASGVRFQLPADRKAADGGLSDPLILARRMVAERCLYGVDKNPLAVEIAKLSLWLVTLDKNKPFSFLDHSLKCGDLLVGCSEEDFLRWAHGYRAASMTLFDDQIRAQLETAREKRRALENFLSDNTQAVEQKTAMLKEAEAAMAHIRRGADLLTGSRLLGLKAQETEDLQINLLFPYMAGELDPSTGSGQAIDPAKHPDAARALAAAHKERAFHWEFAFPEVFEQGGFSAFVGNPPFIRGKSITTNLGDNYFGYLKDKWMNQKGSADYCAYFFLKGFENIKKGGAFGFIATNTIGQGDTREIGLDHITARGGIIYFAVNNMNWVGQAAVTVNVVHVYKGKINPPFRLDDQIVDHISSYLNTQEIDVNPYPLMENAGISHMGTNIIGSGFTLSYEKAQSFIAKDSKYKEILFPFLNGEDVNSSPTHETDRWVINFFDWSLEKANGYEDCMSIVREKVKPLRDGSKRKVYRERWWQFGEKQSSLYVAIANLNYTFATAQTTKNLAFSLVKTGMVYSHALIIIASDKFHVFAVIQSTMHNIWAWQFGSTMRDAGLRYGPTLCFQTYPFPRYSSDKQKQLDIVGKKYFDFRAKLMQDQKLGLTDVYNRFHDPDESSVDIVHLRGLHVEMDSAVAVAYGWGDLSLGHDFHETAQGVRYTVSESARREVLSRLLKLNHERWEAEQLRGEQETGKQGNKKAGKAKISKSSDGQLGLF